MLEDRFIRVASAIRETLSPTLACTWKVPTIEWINGVPGSGKTAWLVGIFNERQDRIVAVITAAAADIRAKLTKRLGKCANHLVRTIASILANGVRPHQQCHRLLVDEALLCHFGAIVTAARLTHAKELVLVGDVRQLPYLDRENLFSIEYCGPERVTHLTRELFCTHRNPMDVPFVLAEEYPGIYTSCSLVRSLRLERFTGAQIPKDQENTLYLVYTQKEKKALTTEGFGSGAGSRTLTIHEAQGLTSDAVYIINTISRHIKLHDSKPHAVVAVSRHKYQCVVFTDNTQNAISRFVLRAAGSPTKAIVEYNTKMAMHHRDHTIIKAMLGSMGDIK